MAFFFWLFAIVMLIAAVGVVVSPSLVHSALYLVVNLFLVAGIFALLGANFLAAAQVIVYAGAIMVLVLFVIMLLGLKPTPLRLSFPMIVGGLVTTGLLGAIVLPLLVEAHSGATFSATLVDGSVKAIGQSLYTRFIFPFEAASLVIMAGVVGAIMLAKKRKAGEQK